METPKSRIVVIPGLLFALILLSLFILRTSLNLMNQKSDMSLVIGIAGVAVTILLWGLVIAKLLKRMRCKECGTTETETIIRREE